MSIPVLQGWVTDLTIMQQGVLLASVRGPDGIVKEHVSKVLLRWYRRCIFNLAFESATAGAPVIARNPGDPGGGSFTGPMTKEYLDRSGSQLGWGALDLAFDDYLKATDEIPHHFQLHFMHAAEVLGYKHPDKFTREWWNKTYRRLANDMHLNPETEEQMDRRLGDSYAQWRAAEEVVAK